MPAQHLAAPQLRITRVRDHGGGIAVVAAHVAAEYEARQMPQLEQCLRVQITGLRHSLQSRRCSFRTQPPKETTTQAQVAVLPEATGGNRRHR